MRSKNKQFLIDLNLKIERKSLLESRMADNKNLQLLQMDMLYPVRN